MADDTRAVPIFVEVETLRLIPNGGTTKAYCAVSFRTPSGSITIDNFRLMRPDGKDWFVAVPDHKKDDKWYKDVKVTGELQQLVFHAVMAAYNRKVAEAEQ